jgi:hypothetical protein
MTSASTDATVRMLIPSGWDASDSSDGIPVSSEDADSEVQQMPSGVVEMIEAEPTRRLPTLSLGKTFAILWALQAAASEADLDIEIDPFPLHTPTGVHLWCSDHVSLCRWLTRERGRRFACVRIREVVPDDLIDAAMFLLDSLAIGMPMAKVISVGHKRFVHLAFRGEE